MNILELVLEAVKEIGEDQENESLQNATVDTRLFGENLDSMGLVFLVTELESKIEEEQGVQVSLADERAMSEKTSPFRNVRTLVKYTQILIEEQKDK